MWKFNLSRFLCGENSRTLFVNKNFYVDVLLFLNVRPLVQQTFSLIEQIFKQHFEVILIRELVDIVGNNGAQFRGCSSKLCFCWVTAIIHSCIPKRVCSNRLHESLLRIILTGFHIVDSYGICCWRFSVSLSKGRNSKGPFSTVISSDPGNTWGQRNKTDSSLKFLHVRFILCFIKPSEIPHINSINPPAIQTKDSIFSACTYHQSMGPGSHPLTCSSIISNAVPSSHSEINKFIILVKRSLKALQRALTTLLK